MKNLLHRFSVSTLVLLVAAGTATAAITGSSIKNGSLTGTDIKDSSIQSRDVANGTITEVDLGKDSVSDSELQDDSVNSNVIDNETILGADIFNATITGLDIMNETIEAVDLAENSVAESELAEDSVGAGELASNSVDSGEIVDGSVGPDELAESPYVLLQKFESQAINFDTYTPITWDLEQSDASGLHETDESEVVVTRTGLYDIRVGISFQPMGNNQFQSIRVNRDDAGAAAAEVVAGVTGTVTEGTVTLNNFVELEAGDTLTVEARYVDSIATAKNVMGSEDWPEILTVFQVRWVAPTSA